MQQIKAQALKLRSLQCDISESIDNVSKYLLQITTRVVTIALINVTKMTDKSIVSLNKPFKYWTQ